MWKAAVRICRGSVPGGACVSPATSGSHAAVAVRIGTTAPSLLRKPVPSARLSASAAASQQQEQEQEQQKRMRACAAGSQQTPPAAPPRQSSTNKRSLDDRSPAALPDDTTAKIPSNASVDGAPAPPDAVIGARKTGGGGTTTAADTASLVDLLVALREQAAASTASASLPAGSRLSLAIQTTAAAIELADVPQRHGAPTVDGAGVALCNALLLITAAIGGSPLSSPQEPTAAAANSQEQATIRPGAVTSLEAATLAALDRQPVPVLLAAARHLELDELSDSPSNKARARQRLLLALKARLADTEEPMHAVLALQTCNTVETAGGGSASSQSKNADVLPSVRRSALEYAELRDAAEHAVLRLIARMDGATVCRVLHSLAVAPVGSGSSTSRSHTVQLMRTLAHQACKRPFVLTGQQLANALYACAALGLYDRRLLMRLDEAATFAAKRNRLAADALASVVLSVGKLRWDSPALMEALFARCCDSSLPLGSRLVPSLKCDGVVSLLHTCAQQAFAPSGLALVADDALARAADGGPDLLLDGTWSLLVVGAHSRAHLSAVLNAEYLKSLGGLQLARHKKAYNDLKLLNIAFEAAGGSRPEFERLQRDVLGSHLGTSKVQVVSKEKSAAALVDDISSVLSYVAPKDTHQCQRVMTAAGHDVDVELLVDSNGQPKPLSDYARPYANSRSGMPVPEGWQWVAIKVLGYYDVLLSSGPLPDADVENVEFFRNNCKPLGRHILAARQLSQMGYAVVMVDYKEYLTSMEASKKLQFLQSKIMSSLQ